MHDGKNISIPTIHNADKTEPTEIVKLLIDKWYYELENGELTFSYEISVGNQSMEKNIIRGKMKTEFTSFSFTENGNLFFGLYDYGILSISFENDISPII